MRTMCNRALKQHIKRAAAPPGRAAHAHLLRRITAPPAAYRALIIKLSALHYAARAAHYKENSSIYIERRAVLRPKIQKIFILDAARGAVSRCVSRRPGSIKLSLAPGCTCCARPRAALFNPEKGAAGLDIMPTTIEHIDFIDVSTRKYFVQEYKNEPESSKTKVVDTKRTEGFPLKKVVSRPPR